jgi:O-antigen/teichoic acid export membrane protein
MNTLLNYALIPTWGMLGAAISTIISYFLMFILIEFIKIDELTQFKKSRLQLFFFNIIALISVIINSYIFYSTGSKTAVTISSIFTAVVLLTITFATNIFNVNSIQNFILSYRSIRVKPTNSVASSENEQI